MCVRIFICKHIHLPSLSTSHVPFIRSSQFVRTYDFAEKTQRKMETLLHKIALQNFCCCLSLQKACSTIGALEWVYTLYLSCRYYDLQKVGCRSPKQISCSQIYYNVLSFVVSIAIVSGVSKKSRAYFIPWLIVKIVEYAAYTVIMIYDLQARFTLSVDILLPLAFALVTMFVFWYSWYCVLSLYVNMAECDDDDDGDKQLMDQSNRQNIV